MTKFEISLFAVAVANCGPFATSAWAAPAESAEEVVNVFTDPAIDKSLFEFSYASPNSPALPLIGVSGDQIARVDSVRKFGVSLLSGLDSSGSGPAAAIDVSPFWLLSTGPVSLWDYRNFDTFKRIAARSKFGAAASKGDVANARPSSIVLSLSTKLFDSQDQLFASDFDRCVTEGPLLNYAKAIREAGATGAIGKPPSEIEAAAEAAMRAKETELGAKIEAAHAKCVTKASAIMTTKPSLDVGLGIRLSGDPGRFRRFSNSGTIVWATFATGIFGRGSNANGETSGPLGSLNIRGIVHARHTFKEAIFDDKFVLQGKRDASMIVAGLETVPVVDKPERVRLGLQGGWNRQNAVLATEKDKNYWRFLGSANVQVSKGFWANFSVGHVTGRGVATDTYLQIGFSFSPPSKASKVNDYYASRN
jgi:hypothetical protein